MTFFIKKNNANSLLVNNPLATGATTLNVTTGEGTNFPSTFPYRLTIYNGVNPGEDTEMEIVHCTGRTVDALTITRGSEGTADVEHIQGSKVALLITAGLFDDSTYGMEGNITTHIADTSTHGVAEIADVATVSAEIDGDIATHTALPNAHHAQAHTLESHDVVTTTGAELNAMQTKLATVATSANNYTHPNHTGEVTSLADGAQTITADAVTNTKMANMATQTIKGRTTAATGDPEDLTATQVRGIINVQDGATDDQSKVEIEALGILHSSTTGQTANDHHNEAHTITSHSDIVDATGAQIEELTGAGNTSLHTHDIYATDTDLSTHAADTSTHGVAAIADQATVSAEIDTDIGTHAALTTTHGTTGNIEDTNNKGLANGYAELDAGGKVPSTQLPLIALTEVFTAASEVAQLALTVEEGDICVRTDENKTYAALNSDNVNMADWQELLSPTDAVQSVFGRSGVVSAQSNDYTWAQVNKTVSDLADLTTKAHSSTTGITSNDHHNQAHSADHTNGTDDIQSATNAQKGLATAAHITAVEANTAKDTNVPMATDGGWVAEGDLAVGTGANTSGILLKGSDNHVLTMNGNVPNWEATKGDILNGGNTNAAAVVVGTNDANDLELESNSTTRMTIESGGNVNVANTLEVDAIVEDTADTGVTIETALIKDKMMYGMERKTIRINSSSDGALTDYQIKLDIPYNSAMEPDFADIRFKETDGTNIPYWIESKTDSGNVEVWIKTDVPAADGKIIYLYFGNSSLSDASSFSNTFITGSEFDDLTGWTQQAGTWTVSSGIMSSSDSANGYLRNDTQITESEYMVNYKFRNKSSEACRMLTECDSPLSEAKSLMNYFSTSANQITIYADSANDVSAAATITNNTWYIGEQIVKSGANYASIYNDSWGNKVTTAVQANDSTGGNYWGFSNNSEDYDVDWIFIRKYTANEPIYSLIDYYPKREKISITASPDGALTDYQIKLTVSYDPAMQANFDDIRFKEVDGTEIPYWLEDKTDSQDAYVWIKTDIPVDGKVIYMYYGNGAASASSGTDTFIQYNGQTSIDFKLVNIQTPPMIIEGRLTQTNSATLDQFGVSNNPSYLTDDSAVISLNNARILYAFVYNEGSITDDNVGGTYSTDAVYKIVLDGTDAKYYINDVLKTTIVSNIPDENMGMWYDYGTGELTWGFIRKYTANEPTVNYNNDILLSSTPGSDHSFSGITSIEPTGVVSAFGDVLHLHTDGEWILAKADATATMPGLRMSTCATVDGTSYELLSIGFARDDTWAWTVGGAIYISCTGTTGNTLTQTAPSGSGDQVQKIGIATHADRIWFNPDLYMAVVP